MGNSTVREINGGAAQACFKIERCPRPNVVRDVGDVDLQLPVAVRQPLYQDRVVEVASSLAVDCDDWQTAKIVAQRQFFPRQRRYRMGSGIVRLSQHVRRERVGQVVLANDDLYVDSEVVRVPKNLKNAAARRLGDRRELGDLDVYRESFQRIVFVRQHGCAASFPSQDSVLCLCGRQDHLTPGPIRDEDGLRHALVQRCDNVELCCRPWHGFGAASAMRTGVMEDPYDRGIAASKNTQDTPRTPSVAAWRSFVHQHFIALHGAVEFVRRDEEIIVAVRRAIGPNKAEAVAMHVELAGDELVAGDALCGLELGSGGARSLFGSGLRQGPEAGVQLYQVTAQRDAGELLQQEPARPSAAQSKLAHQLLVAGPVRWAAFDKTDDLTVGVGIWRRRWHRLTLWNLRKPARTNEWSGGFRWPARESSRSKA